MLSLLFISAKVLMRYRSFIAMSNKLLLTARRSSTAFDGRKVVTCSQTSYGRLCMIRLEGGDGTDNSLPIRRVEKED